jgi:hypothetical protein
MDRICHLTMTHGKENVVVLVPFKEFLASMATEDTIECSIEFLYVEKRHCIMVRPITDPKWSKVYLMNEFEAMGFGVRIKEEAESVG